MSTTLQATALPYSLADDAPFQLSVFFTHKLVGTSPTVAGYPAAEGWVDVLSRCGLGLTVTMPAIVGRRPLTRTLPLRTVSRPDAAAWRALVPGSLRVVPFPAPSGLAAAPIRTNPASRMSEHAIDLHLAMIGSSPGARPRVVGNPVAKAILNTIATLDPQGPVAELLRRERRGDDGELLIGRRLRDAVATLGPLDGPVLNRRGHDEPREEERAPEPGSALDGILHDLDADRRISAQLDRLVGRDLSGQPELRLLVDAHAMRRYYEQRGDRPAPPRPEAPKPDFHSRIASFGSVPALLRRLGLVVDVVVDGMTPAEARAALAGAASVAVAVRSGDADLEVLPARRTAVRVDGAVFQAQSSDAWVDGALPLGEPDWVVLDADPDAAGLKLDQFLRDLPRQYAGQLNRDQASAAPATVRSTGFALARRDRLAQVRARVAQAETLAADATRALRLDDVVRGLRIEVWDDATRAWHSLHERRVDVTAAPGGEPVLSDAADVGFLQSSGLNRRDGELHLHEAVGGWDGWSLSAPRPGLTVERVPEPGPGEPTERMVATPSDAPLEGAHVVSRVEPGSLPRLRYGTSYSFRVLAVDLAGNSTPLPSSSVLDGTGLDDHLRLLRRQYERLDLEGLAGRVAAAPPVEEGAPWDAGRLGRLLRTGDAVIDATTRSLLATVTAAPARAAAATTIAAAAQALQAAGRPVRVRPQLVADVVTRRPPLLSPRPGPVPLPRPARVTVTLPRPYLRWEPVAPPAVVAREELDPGEQLAVLVVRSGGAADRDRSERHLVPPKATQLEAETAGRFDAAIGTRDAAAIRRLYAVALAERGTLLDEHVPSLTDPRALDLQPRMRLAGRPGADPDQPTLDDLAADRGHGLAEGQYVVHDVDRLRLPYLPEPFADGVSLVFSEAGDRHQLADPNNLQTVRVPYPAPGPWPERVPLRLVVERGDRLDARVDGHVVRVSVPEGEQVRVALASTLDPSSLERFGLWRSFHASLIDPSDGYTPDELVAMETIRRAATSGWLWWLTPSTPLRLVHAVPAPVRPPALRGLRVLARPKDRGVAALAGLVDVHGPSTDTLVVRAEWSEWVDDPAQPAPVTVTTSDVVVSSPVSEHESTGVLHLLDLQTDADGLRGFGLHRAIQNFPDTHRRLVAYHPGGTTRYAEYFSPEELPAAPVEGEPVELDIASSARPATPIVRDAVPLLRWSAAPEPGGPFGWRSTRSPGIRIWLDRPWFSSGDGELLGVLVFDRSEYVKRDGAWVTEARTPPPDGATSLWAADPILHAPARVGDPTVPPLLGTEHLILDALTAGFAGAVGIAPPVLGGDARSWPAGPAQPVAVAARLPLLDVKGAPQARVVGYRPEYDEASRRWFVDVALQDTPTASPFVRLAVARWQPHSLPGCELSAVALTAWVQPLPERRLTVNRPDAAHVQVTLSGVTARLRSGDRFSELPGALLSADAPIGEAAARAARLLRSRTVRARLEQLPDGGTDLEWENMAIVDLVPAEVDEGRTQEATWTGSLTIPSTVGIPLRRPGVDGSRWRVVVEEHELLDADPERRGDDPRTLPRLVYADEVTL